MQLNLKLDKKYGLMDYAIIFYIFSIIMADGTYLFYASVLLLYASGFLYVLKNKKMKLHWYCTIIALFVLYNFISSYFGISLFATISRQRFRSVFLNYISSLFIFMYSLEHKNRYKVMKVVVTSAVILIVYILFINFRSVFSMRFGRNTPYLFGLRGSNGYSFNANTVAVILNMSYAFCILFLWGKDPLNNYGKTRNSKLLLAVAGVLVFFIILTGSRKGIITIGLFTLLSLSLKNRTFQGKLKYTVFAFTLIVIGYIVIMNVDVLYNILGKRLAILINGLFVDEDYAYRSSAYFRNNMVNIGMNLFKQRPVFGWGLDSFSQLSPYHTYSHNNFIELLVSDGLIGFVLYYGATAYNLVSSKRFFNDYKIRNESVILFSFMIGSLIMHVGHVVYLSRISLLLDFVFAAAVVDWRRQKKQEV